MFTTETLLMGIATLLLLFVNWLAFHDFGEAHTVRDWLMLVASLLVFVEFANILWKRNGSEHSVRKAT